MDIEDRKRLGQSKKFEDEEFKVILDEAPTVNYSKATPINLAKRIEISNQGRNPKQSKKRFETTKIKTSAANKPQ